MKEEDLNLDNNNNLGEVGSDSSLFTQEQISYANSVPDSDLRSHLLHQVRLRDNMEEDRNSFEKMYNDLCLKYMGKHP